MIKILYKYIIKNFIKTFIFIAMVFSIVVIISQLLAKINFYMENKATLGIVLVHILTIAPEWFIEALPITILLTLLFSLSNLAKRNEITAMKATGINMWCIVSLFITIGLIMGIIDFSCREFVIPKTAIYNWEMETKKIKKELLVQTDSYNQIIVLKNNVRLTFGHFDIKTNTIKNIVLEKYNKDFELKMLVLAKKADWENGSLVLKSGVARISENNFLDGLYFKAYVPNINVTPDDIIFKDPPYTSMNMSGFNKYINQLQFFGRSTIKTKIVLNMRFSSAFSHVIIMMMGIPFALGFGKRVNIALVSLATLSTTFIYWITQAVTTSLGKNLILSPFMAAWLPNFIFFGIGAYLLVKMEK